MLELLSIDNLPDFVEIVTSAQAGTLGWFGLIASAIGLVLLIYTYRKLTRSNRKVRALEKRLHFTEFSVRHSSVPTYWLDENQKIIFVNESACESLGYSEEELLSLRVPDIDPDSSEEGWHEIRADMRSTGGAIRVRRHTRKDGSQFPVEMVANSFAFEGSNYYCFFMHDLTERKWAEDVINEMSARATAILENVVDAVITIDVNGTIDSANRAVEGVFGYEQSELVGQDISMLMPEPHRSLHDQYVHAYLDSGISKIIGIGREVVALHKDGTVFPVQLSVSEVSVNERRVFTGVIRDLTESKRSEEDRFRLATAIEQAADAIVITDMALHVQYCNPAYEKLTGYSKDEIATGQVRVEWVHEDELDDATRKLAEDENWVGRYTGTSKTGGNYTTLVTVTPVRNIEGVIRNYVIIQGDITEQVKLEEQLLQSRKMEAIGNLAGGIAHDFNNILQSVLGYARLARDETEPGTLLRQCIDAIDQGGRRAAHLVDQILTFSRKRDTERRPTLIQHVLSEIIDLVKSTLPSTIRLECSIDENCGPVLADVTQIHQVVMNLCTNAHHAMRAEGGVLRITVREVARNELPPLEQSSEYGYMLLEVKDTGCGMNEETREKIFDPFFTTKAVNEGTGLGLSTVHGIVKDSEGEVTVESTLGAGSTFRVFLPMCAESEVQELAESLNADETRKDKRILFVDDEVSIVKIMTMGLERSGYTVESYTKSSDAFDAFRAQPERYDAVITDMTMPRPTGVELAEQMLGIRPNIPIVICTGYNESIDEAQCRAIGIRRVLKKPVDYKELSRFIESVLHEKGQVPSP